MSEVIRNRVSIKIRPKETVVYETDYFAKNLVSVVGIGITGIKNDSEPLQEGAVRATLYNDGLSTIIILPNTPLLQVNNTKEVSAI